MPAIDANTLFEETKCYACLGLSQAELLKLGLLSRIAEGGGGSVVVEGSGGYALFFNGGWEAGVLGDNNNFYYGGDLYNSTRGGMNVYNNCRIMVPKTGTVTRFYIKVRITTVGSAEAVSHFLRLNDVTNFGQIDLAYSATTAEGSLTNLSQAVVAGDYLALFQDCPVWVTNPQGMRVYSYAWIEY